jgi:hypothetical protein
VFFHRRSSMMFSVMNPLNPNRSSNSRTKSRPLSEVTREPLEIDSQRRIKRELKGPGTSKRCHHRLGAKL